MSRICSIIHVRTNELEKLQELLFSALDEYHHLRIMQKQKLEKLRSLDVGIQKANDFLLAKTGKSLMETFLPDAVAGNNILLLEGVSESYVAIIAQEDIITNNLLYTLSGGLTTTAIYTEYYPVDYFVMEICVNGVLSSSCTLNENEQLLSEPKKVFEALQLDSCAEKLFQEAILKEDISEAVYALEDLLEMDFSTPFERYTEEMLLQQKANFRFL